MPTAAAGAPEAAPTETALEAFRDSQLQVHALVTSDATDAEVVHVVDALLDYATLSTTVRGSRGCADRCAEFDALLTALVRRSYLEQISAEGSGNVVIVDQNTKTRNGETRARVNTIVVFAGARGGKPRTIKVSYLMHPRDGRWRVYDIRTEGLSLARVIKRDLAALYREGGLDRVLTRMASKLAEPG